MDIQDARLGFLCRYAESAFTAALATPGGLGAAQLKLPVDHRMGTAWKLHGWLTGRDSAFGADPQTVFYGWLLEGAPGQFVAVIRGTGDGVEWFIDAEWVPRQGHPGGVGEVETGFWLLYATMELIGTDGSISPAAQGIARIVGTGSLTVTGHSLGSALATFLSFDLSALGNRLTAVLFASPKAGNLAFGDAFAVKVPAHRSYWWAADMVPRLPFGFGFALLPHNVELALPPGLTVCGDLRCAHHATTYVAMGDLDVLKEFQPVTAEDRQMLACLTIRLPVAA